MRPAVDVEQRRPEGHVPGEIDSIGDAEIARPGAQRFLEQAASDPPQDVTAGLVPLQLRERVDEGERILFRIDPSDREQPDRARPIALRRRRRDVGGRDERDDHR